jgi:hypothetical protein
MSFPVKRTHAPNPATLLTLLQFPLLATASGSDAGTLSAIGLGTAQRNISAALEVAGQNEALPQNGNHRLK